MAVERFLVADTALDESTVSGLRQEAWQGSVMEIILFHVPEGEAILVRKGTRGLLIDGGSTTAKRNENEAKAMLQRFPAGVRLEAVIASHPHKDHTNFLPYLLVHEGKWFAPDAAYYDNGTPLADNQWTFLVEEARDANKPLLVRRRIFRPTAAVKTRSLAFGAGARLLLTEGAASEPDYWSVFLLLRHGKAWMLFTGDAKNSYERKVWKKIKDARLTDRVHFWKITHHGSKSGTASDVIRKAKPAIAATSSDADLKHNLEKKTRDTLDLANVRWFATYEDRQRPPRVGDLIIRTDGKQRRVGPVRGLLFEVEH